MKKSQKVIGIIVSCVSFAAILFFLLGMFALPPIRVSAELGSDSSSVYTLISEMIDAIKDMAGKEGGALGEAIGKLMTSVAFVVIFAIFVIMGVVKGIVLLIKSIKALSKPEENKPAVKELVGFAVLGLLYNTLVLAVFYSKTELYTKSIGAGAVMILVGSLLSLCAAGAYVFVSREQKLVNKILDFATSSLAVVGLMLLLFAPVGSEGEHGGVIAYLAGKIGGMVGAAAGGGVPDYLATIMTIFGSALLFVAVGFVKAVILNGYRLEAEEKKGVDYPKSSIVKSSLWLGFAVVGVILLFVVDKGVGIAVGGIMTFVFAALTLACAIVNKVLSPKAEKPAEAKAE